MQVSLESSDGLERKLKVEIPAERIDSAVNKKITDLSRTVKIKGFRPGKVPAKVIEARYGAQVQQEVLGEVIQESFQEAIKEQALRPAGFPDIAPGEIVAGKDFEYMATFEVFPEIELASPDSIEVDKPSAGVTDKDVDEMVEELRQQRATWEDADRAATEGDQVVIDFKGSIEGEAFEGGASDNFNLVLGSGSMIPGFEDQLTGVSANDEKNITVTFPEDYQAENLAGKEAVFEVKVHTVQASILPEVDETFIKAFGVENGGIEELKETVRKNMERELEQAIESSIKQQVMDGLLEINDIPVPTSMVNEEIGRMKQQFMQRLGAQGQSGNLPQLEDELFKGDAERRVKLGLIVSELSQQENITATANDVRNFIEKLASSYQEPEQVVNYYYQNQELLSNIEGMVVEQKTAEWVLDKAKVTDKESDFRSIVKRG
ncbi:MAG: trigger factor [Gammaproteobacteria bacterium]|nr:trigger factor [Gammaproteobacteria bacterium]